MNRIVLAVAVLATFSFISKEKKFKAPDHFVFIPSGNLNLDQNTHSLNAFWMLDHEVTNGEYRFFLNHLKTTNRMEDYQTALPDTSAWNDLSGYHQPMADYYFWHPAYAEYPVVNISAEAAQLYCEYLTSEIENKYGRKIGNFRLPTREEWVYAANSGFERSIYSWGTYSLRDDEGNTCANFLELGEQNFTKTESGYMLVNDSLLVLPYESEYFYTASAYSYQPSEYGLYNMNGNVAELLAEPDLAAGGHWRSPGFDIRNTSVMKTEGPSPLVGFRPVMSYMHQE